MDWACSAWNDVQQLSIAGHLCPDKISFDWTNGCLLINISNTKPKYNNFAVRLTIICQEHWAWLQSFKATKELQRLTLANEHLNFVQVFASLSLCMIHTLIFLFLFFFSNQDYSQLIKIKVNFLCRSLSLLNTMSQWYNSLLIKSLIVALWVWQS